MKYRKRVVIAGFVLAASAALAACSGNSATPAPAYSVDPLCVATNNQVVPLTTATTDTCSRQAFAQGAILVYTDPVSVSTTAVAGALHLRPGLLGPTGYALGEGGLIPSVPGATAPPPQPTALPSPLPNLTASPQPQTLLAVHSSLNGLHTFHGFGTTMSSQSFKNWINREQTTPIGQVGSPGGSSWYQILDSTLSWSTPGNDWTTYPFQPAPTYWEPDNNNAIVDFTIYRLPSNNALNDYYLVQTAFTDTPTVNSNSMSSTFWTYSGAIGWWVPYRYMDFSTASGDGAQLAAWGPQNTQETSTTSLSIGASIGANASGPTASVNATWGQTWSQPSVNTTLQLFPGTSEAKWTEAIDGWSCSAFSCSDVSGDGIASYQSYQAAIYTVPAGSEQAFQATGTTQFHIDDYDAIGVGQGNSWSNEFSTITATADVKPPVFAVDQTSVNVAPGAPAVVNVTASDDIVNNGPCPTSLAPLNWAVVNGNAAPLPTWISLQPYGAGSGQLIITANGGTAPGQSTTVYLDTVPAALTPATRFGPLRVTVTTVAPPSPLPQPPGTPAPVPVC